MNWEKEIEQEDFESEDEREYIRKLNKNIKDNSKKTKTANKKNTDNKYLDLDHYFEKLVEQKVKNEEEEMHVQPVGFTKYFSFVVVDFNFSLKDCEELCTFCQE